MWTSGVYVDIYWKIPPWGGESADVIWGKNMTRRKEKGGKCKRKRKRGEERGKTKEERAGK
jgi:hypothetical protein